MEAELQLEKPLLAERASKLSLYKERGKLAKSIGLTYEGYLPGAAIGSIVGIIPNVGQSLDLEKKETMIKAEVIGFKDRRVVLMPLDEAHGLSSSSKLILLQNEACACVGPKMLGRVLDGKGEPIDDLGMPNISHKSFQKRSLYSIPVNPMKRQCIEKPLDLGVRAINGLLTCGKGQRMGIFAGSGVGKSVLLGMMARHTKADVNVIALIGERGREVNEFIERDLGKEGLKKSVVVVVTSDKSPLLRMRGAFLAAAIAEYFCEMGKDVLFLMDSVTRFAMAQREIGLSMGEPPASKGYTPSVFSTLPKLLERAGTRSGRGSITGLYTVLVEGDDLDDPIADAARSILDGHIVLSRSLANKNHYPAIDVGASVSRVMRAVIDQRHTDISSRIRDLMAVYAANEDLINIGAYVKGTNPKLDQAIAVIDKINSFLKQGIDEASTYSDSVVQLESVLRGLS